VNPESRASTPVAGGIDAIRTRYVELLKRALTHTLYWPIDIDMSESMIPPAPEFEEALVAALQSGELDLLAGREEGKDWPRFAQTMVGTRRLDNVQACVERVLADGVPGDLIETGVWRGGVAIFMRGLLEAWEDPTRVVVAADSFQGLPPPDTSRYPADANDQHHSVAGLAVSREDVARNFSLYGLLDDRVEFLEGWFRDTLPTVHDRTWAVIRLDGDMYESTMDGLVHLYPRLSPGGFLIIDDYGYVACRQAVDDYRTEHGITEPVEAIDWVGAFWRKAC
jgi:O-methyltransferase